MLTPRLTDALVQLRERLHTDQIALRKTLTGEHAMITEDDNAAIVAIAQAIIDVERRLEALTPVTA